MQEPQSTIIVITNIEISRFCRTLLSNGNFETSYLKIIYVNLTFVRLARVIHICVAKYNNIGSYRVIPNENPSNVLSLQGFHLKTISFYVIYN